MSFFDSRPFTDDDRRPLDGWRIMVNRSWIVIKMKIKKKWNVATVQWVFKLPAGPGGPGMPSRPSRPKKEKENKTTCLEN